MPLPPTPPSRSAQMARTLDTEICIVGAGIAGLFAVLTLPEGTDVVVLDKGYEGIGSSPLAQGGMAAAVGPGDSWQSHLDDTLQAGAGLVDRRSAEVVCREVPDRIRDLVDYGCGFDRNPDGSLNLAREGGQSVPRSVHRMDATGAEVVRALRAAADSRFRRAEARATSLALSDGRCTGVWAASDEELLLVRARATLLASGGAGALFAFTTNAPASTGDALALAHRAGARMIDLEFVQFHPTVLKVESSPMPLLTEALRGAGALLVDASGRRFMLGAHPDAELAPRHVVTAGIMRAGDAFLDARPVGHDRLESEFPTVTASCLEHGFDITREPVPVTPAAHYMIGGAGTRLDGSTSVPGLFAAGECATTGMHGANRLAGNSLAEAVVFARRAALAMTAYRPTAGSDPEWETPPAGPAPIDERMRAEIVAAVSMGAGPVRDAASCAAGLTRLEGLTAEAQGRDGGDAGSEASAMLASGKLLVRGALAREESRGVHVRSDFPAPRLSYEGIHLDL